MGGFRREGASSAGLAPRQPDAIVCVTLYGQATHNQRSTVPAHINLTAEQLRVAADLDVDLTVYEDSARVVEALEFVQYATEPDNPARRSVIIDTQGNVLSDQWHTGDLG